MKSHRLHPEMGHSMHYIRLVRGEKHQEALYISVY